MREKSELSKEERRQERATRKRKIKSHLKHKETERKEVKRAQGIAMNDRFEMRHLQKKAAAQKKSAKDDEGAVGSKKNDMKSSKFFSRLQDVAKDDQARKEQKRQAKRDGNAQVVQHNNESTKRFKLWGGWWYFN